MGKYHKTHAYQLLERYQQYLHGYHNGSAIIIPHLHIVDIVQVADMHESYGTYVNDHKKDSYTAAGAAPTQTRPGHAGPSQTPKILYVWLWHEWVPDRSDEALDPPKCRFLWALSIWIGP